MRYASAVLACALSFLPLDDAWAQTASAGAGSTSEVFLSLEEAMHQLPALRTPVRVPGGITVAAALRSIAEQIGFRLIYREGLPGLDARIPQSLPDFPAGDALARILEPTRVTLRVSRSGQIVVVARPAVGRGTISGTVLDAERVPVPGALVSLAGARSVLADSTGAFVLPDVPAGKYALGISALGYAPLRLDSLQVVAGQVVRVDTVLAIEALPLAAVVVTPGTFRLMQENATRPQVLTRADIEAMPQLLEDINRALTRLPGVASEDASARFSLRGGRYDELLVLLDGVELDEPFHLLEVGGVLSIVDVEAIGGVQMTSDGFTAEYGNRLTGMVDMSTLSRPTLGTHFSAGLSASNARLMGRGTFAGDRGQWLLSARRGYFDLVLGMMGEDDQGYVPRYGDILGKVDYRLSDSHRISFHVLGANDALEIRPGADSDDPSDHDYKATSGSAYAWTNWRAYWLPRLSTRTVLSLSRMTRDRGGIGEPYGIQNGIGQRDHRLAHAAALRQDWTWAPTERQTLKWGADLKRVSADYDRSIIWPGVLDSTGAMLRLDRIGSHTGTDAGGYLAYRARPWNVLTGEAGLRYDHHDLTGDRLWSPRLNLALFPRAGTALRLAWGRSYQAQSPTDLAIDDGDTLFYPAERAEHRVIGLEQALGRGITGRFELYERRMSSLRPRYFNATNIFGPVPETEPDRIELRASSARARGVELLVTREPGASHIRWSASYALASVNDRVGDLTVPRLDDSRHVLQLEAGYRPSDGFSLNLAWQYRSGKPVFVPAFGLDTLATGMIYRTETYDLSRYERLPAYHRLDVRVTRSMRVGGGRMNVFLDVFNAYSRHNPRGWDFTPAWNASGGYTLARAAYAPNFGILPTFGASWEF